MNYDRHDMKLHTNNEGWVRCLVASPGLLHYAEVFLLACKSIYILAVRILLQYPPIP